MFKLTYLGHAGWLIEHDNFKCICDPWFNPDGAFFSQWSPFPDNSTVLKDSLLENLDFIYISHAHEDHFDPWLLEKVEKDTPILIPRFEDPVLIDGLRKLGFKNIKQMSGDKSLRIKDISLTIIEDDGYLDRDSCLLLDDGKNRILNLNDCHIGFDELKEKIGQVDLLLLQATSAIWWPCAYDYPEDEMRKRCEQKRNNAVKRAVNYAKALNPRLTIPNAGPPVFRAPNLQKWNVSRRSNSNPFILMDDSVDCIQAQGYRAASAIPGSQILIKNKIEVVNDEREVSSIYGDIEEYQKRYFRKIIRATGEGNVLSPNNKIIDKFKERVRAISTHSQIYAKKLQFLILFDFQELGKWIVNFSNEPKEAIVEYDASKHTQVFYEFMLNPVDLENFFDSKYIDFERYFLGMNFRCKRHPDEYNEILFTVLKNFDLKRLLISEKVYASRKDMLDETFILTHQGESYKVQKYCPHMLANLETSGYVNDNNNLVCSLHGWEFSLNEGMCLNNRRCSISIEKRSEI